MARLRVNAMRIDVVRGVLLWCAVLNYALLLLWFALLVLARDLTHPLVRRWFRISSEQIDVVNYAGMAFYKICVFLFNIVPYVALRIVG